MNSSLAGILQIVLLVAALAVCYKPLGDYIARVFMSPKHWRVEKGFYRVIGVDPDADQRWGTYARSMLAFSGICVLFLYLLQRIQQHLPYSNGQAPVPSFLAWNTAASFVTNTNWQNYSGESTMGYTVQMAGLAVQNFVSAAVGIVVVIALIRGFMRNKTDLPAARHPVRAAAHLRQDGRRQPAGLPAGRRHGRAVARRGRRYQLLRMAARGHRPAGRARRDGGQGGPVRHPRLVSVRRIDNRDFDRGRQQLP
jgi:hypothetical protein